MEWSRPRFTQPVQSPFLFYLLIGAQTGKMQPSRSRHFITSQPEGLEVHGFQADNPGHKAWLDGFFEGNLGEFLAEKGAGLLAGAKAWKTAAVVTGNFADSASLEYLRLSQGFVQALIETGAQVVLDAQTLKWYTADEWTQTFFQPQLPLPHSQVWILKSEREEGVWLHTRGLRKFGRPDLSLRHLTEEQVPAASVGLNKIIAALAEGLAPDQLAPTSGTVDDPEFNNTHLELTLASVTDFQG